MQIRQEYLDLMTGALCASVAILLLSVTVRPRNRQAGRTGELHRASREATASDTIDASLLTNCEASLSDVLISTFGWNRLQSDFAALDITSALKTQGIVLVKNVREISQHMVGERKSDVSEVQTS